MKLRKLGFSWTLVLVAQLSIGSVPLAHAQSTKAIAEAAYRRGQELMRAGKADDACPHFAESQRLDPAVGTLVALAACHEAQGKIATAWGEFTEAATMGGPAAQFAQKRAIALEAEVTRVTFAIGDLSADTKAFLDDTELAVAVLRGGALPVDPGKHVLRLTSPGKTPGETPFEVTRGTKTLDVAAVLPTAVQEPTTTGSPTATGSSTPHETSRAVAVDQTPSNSTVLPWVLMGVGAASLVTGGVLGIVTLSKDSDRKAALERQEFDQADRIRDDALGLQTAAFITAGVGVVAAGVGVVLLLTSSTPSGTKQAMQPMRPAVSWGVSPAHVAGTFTWSF